MLQSPLERDMLAKRGHNRFDLKDVAADASPMVNGEVVTFGGETVKSSPLSSGAAIMEFQREHPAPSTGQTTGACPGYWRDHIVPLDCGGPDAVSNMQWQTVVDARAKDAWERKGCGR